MVALPETVLRKCRMSSDLASFRREFLLNEARLEEMPNCSKCLMQAWGCSSCECDGAKRLTGTLYPKWACAVVTAHGYVPSLFVAAGVPQSNTKFASQHAACGRGETPVQIASMRMHACKYAWMDVVLV